MKMIINSLKNTNYSYDIKIRAVVMRLQGQKYNVIQKLLNIKNHYQIYSWVRWYQNGQIYRFKNSIGQKYTHTQKYLFPDAKIGCIKKTLKTQLAKNKKHHQTQYLKIIQQNRSQISLNRLLKWLNFSKSSYYRALKIFHQPQPLTTLEKTIQTICHSHRIHPLLKNKLILGYRKVHHRLQQQGFQLNPKTVLTKMRQLNLLCQTSKNTALAQKNRQFYYSDPLSIRPNLINLDFKATRPYQKLVTDMTYLPNKLYLSAIMDLYNREIVAFQIAPQQDLKLVIATIQQLPPIDQPCIFHMDQGCQYTNQTLNTILKNHNLQPSFSPKASSTHNAPLESFWGSLKTETFKLIKKNCYLSIAEIITIITNFIKYYNQIRAHQSLNYHTPQTFKLQNYPAN